MYRIAFAVLPLLVLLNCTNEQLVPIEEHELVETDDRVDLEAEFCTRPAENVTFPVKVVLVLDGSGSLQFTDQGRLRILAVRDLMSSLATQNDVFVSTLVFGSNVYLYPNVDQTAGQDTAFIPASEWVEPPWLGVADVQTNYQGGLSALRSLLLMDMLNADPAELARSKYVVVFFSDGAPSPLCCITAEETQGTLDIPFGCAPEPWEVPDPATAYCEGAAEIPVCNRNDWLDNFRDANGGDPGATPNFGDGALAALNDLEAGNNYNRTYQIEDLVSEAVELSENFGVGEFRFHTALLYDSNLPDAVKEIYRLNRCRSEGLLQSMADIGGGVFRDFENSGEIDFLSFNFTALKQGFDLVGTYAYNKNAVVRPGGFLVDSDGDGLDDDEEFEVSSSTVVADSDKLVEPVSPAVTPVELDPSLWGDGYSDLMEARLIENGYHPLYQSLPVAGCPDFAVNGVDRVDLDADGLNGCEESVIGTEIDRADTDGDGLNDWVEFRLGLDPLLPEANRDDDFDGRKNTDEVRRGTDPVRPDADARAGDTVRYELVENGQTPDGRTCYKANVNNLRLVPTVPRPGGSRAGYNDIYFWVAEAPADNPTGRTVLRVGCVRAQYVPPSFKDPPQGELFLTEEDLYDLDNDDTKALLNSGADICVGVVVQ